MSNIISLWRLVRCWIEANIGMLEVAICPECNMHVSNSDEDERSEIRTILSEVSNNIYTFLRWQHAMMNDYLVACIQPKMDNKHWPEAPCRPLKTVTCRGGLYKMCFQYISIVPPTFAWLRSCGIQKKSGNMILIFQCENCELHPRGMIPWDTPARSTKHYSKHIQSFETIDVVE